MKILLYHSDKFLGKAIQAFEVNNWNHTGIEVDGYVYEMLGRGIVKRTIAESIQEANQVVYSEYECDEEKAKEILEGYLKNRVKYYFRGIAQQAVYRVTEFIFDKPLWIGKNYIDKRYMCSTLVAKVINQLDGSYPEWWLVAPEDFGNNY